jgi:hypothetical protein
MSWHFSRALVEESLGEDSSAGALFAPLSSTPKPEAFFCAGRTTDACDLSLCGMTFEPLTAERGEALLTWFREASPARTSPPQGRAPASTEKIADSGERWRGWFARYDPATSSWRTAQTSLVAGFTEFSGTWPRWGSMRSGVCWERTPPALTTSGSGSGSWLPTPSGVNGGKNHTMGRVDEWGGSSNPLRGTVIGSMCLPEFEELVMGWPVMWTERTPYETGRFREWLQVHSGSSPNA